jgi:hypothetical protein
VDSNQGATVLLTANAVILDRRESCYDQLQKDIALKSFAWREKMRSAILAFILVLVFAPLSQAAETQTEPQPDDFKSFLQLVQSNDQLAACLQRVDRMCWNCLNNCDALVSNNAAWNQCRRNCSNSFQCDRNQCY